MKVQFVANCKMSSDPSTSATDSALHRTDPHSSACKELILEWYMSKTNKEHTDHYKVQWQIKKPSKDWTYANEVDEKHLYSLFTIPDDATKVRVRVKPVAKTHKAKGSTKETKYYTGEWCGWLEYTPWDRLGTAFSTPQLAINDKGELAISVVTNEKDAKQVKFKIEYAENDKFKWKTYKSYTGSDTISLKSGMGVKYIQRDPEEIGWKYRAKAIIEFKDGSQHKYDEVEWSGICDSDNLIPDKTPTPSAEIVDDSSVEPSHKKLKVTMTNYNDWIEGVRYTIAKSNSMTFSYLPTTNVFQPFNTTNSATCEMPVELDVIYKVRAAFKIRGVDKYVDVSEWTNELTVESTVGTASCSIYIKDDIATLKATGVPDGIDIVEFEVYVNDSNVKLGSYQATASVGVATVQTPVSPGQRYKARCRIGRYIYANGIALNTIPNVDYSGPSSTTMKWGEWSEYTDNCYSSPQTPDAFTSIITEKFVNNTASILLMWDPVPNADRYKFQYTTNESYFITAPDKVTDSPSDNYTGSSAQIDIQCSNGENTLYFRLAAGKEMDDDGTESTGVAWSEYGPISSIGVGKEPSPPTTWQSRNSASIGDEVTLYWIHNAVDGSKLKESNLWMELNDVAQIPIKMGDTSGTTADDAVSKTQFYKVDSSDFSDGTILKWKVQTKGAFDKYGDYSIEREVKYYTKPSLMVGYESECTQYPIIFDINAMPLSQKPLSYHMSIFANENYETTNVFGEREFVSSGQQVFYRYIDGGDNHLELELKPSDAYLENGVEYRFVVTAAMDSGLTAEFRGTFTTSFGAEEFLPEASITFDYDTYAAYIRPSCFNTVELVLDPDREYTEEEIEDILEQTERTENVTLSVYRREYDGSYTEIATGLENIEDITVTDPHPSLDLSRYRIVATSTINVSMSYTDINETFGVSSVIIQWEEAWKTYVGSDNLDDEFAESAWAGSQIKLDYDIDIANTNNMDVAMLEYIGREHPVSYYGTQKGETSTWNMSIPKDDTETIYQLRRLSIYPGDAYVREPSGIGYWAQVQVSFSTKHCETSIPVTLNITRVEGGV